MATDESKRRKDNCISCKDFKPIKAKNMCQNCWHKVKRKNEPNFLLRTRYTEIKQRCTNKNNDTFFRYKGKLNCTREQFLNKFIKDKSFLKLFKQWKTKNFDYKFSPSVDRIDNSKDYSIDNMQFITHSANSLKDSYKIPIKVIRNGVIIGIYESINEACRRHYLQPSNVHKVIKGERKHTRGCTFEAA